MAKTDMSSVEPSTEIYERELGEREHIIEQCPIDVYCSSAMPRWGYPFKLMSYWETRPAVADSCESLIIDSGYRKYGDMNEILENAERYDAEWLIPPDITPHFYCYDAIPPAARAKELARHLRRYQRKDLATGVLLPLHRPVSECLEELMDPTHTEKWSEYQDGESLLDVFGGVAIGLKGLESHERMQILSQVHEQSPQDTHVHGLSPGTEMDLLAFLRQNPDMVDTLDVSTPEHASRNNKMPDNQWHQHKVNFPSGTDVTTLRSLRALEIAMQLNYMLGPLCNDSEFEEIRDEQRLSREAVADD